MRQIIHVVILLFIIPCSVYSPSVPDIEKLLETNDIESSEDYYEDMINSLIHLSVQPINLNSAWFDSLKMLFFLSDAQIDNLLDFRKKHGAFTHPNELLLITGISQQDLSNIKPFIRIGTYTPEKQSRYHLSQEILARLKMTRPKQKVQPESLFVRKGLYHQKTKPLSRTTRRYITKIQNIKPATLARGPHVRKRPGRKLFHEKPENRVWLSFRPRMLHPGKNYPPDNYRWL